MAAAFGISFGSTSTCLAVHKDGKTEVIANDAGDRTTPAMVAFTDHDKVVGLAAKHALLSNTQNTICNVRQMLGFQSGDAGSRLQQLVDASPVKIVMKDGRPYYQVAYKNNTTVVGPEDVAQDLFQTLQDLAHHHGDCDAGGSAVIAVPSDFTEAQKASLSRSASKGGFKVLRTICEPAAAALAYDIGQETRDGSEKCNVLVLRMGETTSDASLLTVVGGMYRLLCCCRSYSLGGQQFTRALAEHFAGEFKRLHRMDLNENKRAMAKLANAAQQCKHVLSRQPSGSVFVESIHEGVDFQSSIGRARFDGLCTRLLAACQSLIEEALQAAALTKADVHEVVLSGGATMTPCIQKLVNDFLPSATLRNNIPGDEVIAIGSAKEAAILLGHEDGSGKQNVAAVDCISCEIGIKVNGGEYTRVLASMLPFPIRVRRKFLVPPGSTELSLEVLELSSADSMPRHLGTVKMSSLSDSAAVDTSFQIDSLGNLDVSCHEVGTNQKAHLTVHAAPQEE